MSDKLTEFVGKLNMRKEVVEKIEKITDVRVKLAYKNGKIDGITLYAWWKNGTQYVGCGIETLEQAIKEVNKEFSSELDIFELVCNPDYTDIDKKWNDEDKESYVNDWIEKKEETFKENVKLLQEQLQRETGRCIKVEFITLEKAEFKRDDK